MWYMCMADKPFGDLDADLIMAGAASGLRPETMSIERRHGTIMADTIKCCWEADPAKRYCAEQLLDKMREQLSYIEKRKANRRHLPNVPVGSLYRWASTAASKIFKRSGSEKGACKGGVFADEATHPKPMQGGDSHAMPVLSQDEFVDEQAQPPLPDWHLPQAKSEHVGTRTQSDLPQEHARASSQLWMGKNRGGCKGRSSWQSYLDSTNTTTGTWSLDTTNNTCNLDGTANTVTSVKSNDDWFSQLGQDPDAKARSRQPSPAQAQEDCSSFPDTAHAGLGSGHGSHAGSSGSLNSSPAGQEHMPDLNKE